MLETGHLARYSLYFLILFYSTSIAQVYPNEIIDSLLNKGISQILVQDYTGARLTFTNLDRKFPNEPFGKIYLVATEISNKLDYIDEFNEKYIDSLFAKIEIQIDQISTVQPLNKWNDYFNALSLGYKAYYEALRNNYIDAFGDGYISMQKFQECLQADSNFVESYIAIGTYEYWKSNQVKYLNWLPFVTDNRRKGIEFLEYALKFSTYNQYLAAYSLIWIYINNGENLNAITLAQNTLKEYPESRFFKWTLARAYEDVDPDSAIKIYYDILYSLNDISKRNNYNDIVLKHKIAMILAKKGDNSKALQLCNEILDFVIESDIINTNVKNRIERIKKLKYELEGK